MSKKGESDTKRSGKYFFPILLIFVFLAWVTWPFLLSFGVPWLSRFVGNTPLTIEQMGVLGDLFGGINALFTAAAFAAVWWTGRMQREDLELQRKDLELQRNELVETRGVLAQQTFEATFFQMLAMLREIGNSVAAKVTPGSATTETTGAQAWKVYADVAIHDAFNQLTVVIPQMKGRDSKAIRSAIAQSYENGLYYEYEPWLGPYFRALYNLFKLIEGQKFLDEGRKAMYGNIIRSQLSSNILNVLAINGCSDTLAKGITKFISKYRLLKHLPANNLSSYLRMVYPPETFEDRPT